MALPWWQHHKHCLGYYYYYYPLATAELVQLTAVKRTIDRISHLMYQIKFYWGYEANMNDSEASASRGRERGWGQTLWGRGQGHITWPRGHKNLGRSRPHLLHLSTREYSTNIGIPSSTNKISKKSGAYPTFGGNGIHVVGNEMKLSTFYAPFCVIFCVVTIPFYSEQF